ncbi:hypothetical protein MFLAVUS_010405 [Mucor flavus]|uniref:CRAL-TRIO domain-containing protein n=1 Tax=Mucor flavus TaxID=439312 RepID=A0ABP9ZCS3_9FUNG
MSSIVFPTSEITLQNRKPAHAGNLTESQLASLKAFWIRLLQLFKQPGQEIILPDPAKERPVKKSFFGAVKEDPYYNYFLGATSDPRWSSLPLEKALPLIPGNLLRDTFWGLVASNNPDSTILRFLRARKWDLDASYNMLTNTLRWRLEMRANEIASLGQTGLINELEKAKPGLGVAFKDQLDLKMVTLGGPDKQARGACFVNVQIHHKENQPLEVMKLLTLYMVETSRVVCDYPMDTVCIVFNLENFTLANMDFDIVKFLVECFQAYYPETLGLACIHKAPWVFSTVWNLISPLLDPVVASKIVFTKNLEELEKFIDSDGLPVIITGDTGNPSLDDLPLSRSPEPGYKDVPVDLPCVKQYWDTVANYETQTLQWANQPAPTNLEQDLLDRLKIAQLYRLSRIKAEKVLRGETSYHVKGLIEINENDRLIINYNTRTWGRKDITDWV